ncbi:MAG: HlyD family efflux transporter periplasmic adaptor subunit [Polyangiaceae bacterium]|nr:HlyD family efflux transporter periplasmic adaptor subunit [Polyangiaceae bacterium]MCE7890158.1 HlyD family efflux transporter periplasmic adaptor subunit [Sorangiineae bacterium PRO1]MCL4749816.1 HlyD family efflux transporter periplasmic adaptor subunit [Myxococcales bacterium]
MIKNCLRLALLVAPLFGGGCNHATAEPDEAYQGVIELDERVLGFEVGGRVERVEVRRGDAVKGSAQLAALDSSLEKTAAEARAAEVDAAKAQVALLKAGARPEEIRAMDARIRAVKTTEALLTKNLARERELEKRGVSSRAAIDEIETKLGATIADRQALEQQLKALKRGARSQEIAGATSRAQAADKTLSVQAERVDRHVLKAPKEAVVLDVHVEPGEVVAPGAPVVTLGDTSHPYADVFVPIGKLDGIKLGTAAAVRVDSTSAAFPAKVEHIARATEFTPRYLFSERERPNLVIRVRLRIEDPEQRLHAGVPAFAKFAR